MATPQVILLLGTTLCKIKVIIIIFSKKIYKFFKTIDY